MRALLTPRMMALHVLVIVVVAVLVSLGLWQLDRHAEASVRAAAVEERLDTEPAPVSEVLGAGRSLADTDALAALEFRSVTATGTWRAQDEVLQRGRDYRGRAGLGVLTPLDLEDGTTVLVRRGIVPFDNDLVPPVAAAAPPDGLISVTGTLERSVPQPTGPVAQRDEGDGELDLVFNSDLERLAPQLVDDDSRLLPMVLRLDEGSLSQASVATDVVVAPPPPEPDRGPHLNYAIQWFSFALIGAGMYALYLRRRAAGDERAISRDDTRARSDAPR